MTPTQIHQLFSTFAALNPAPETELVYTNPYTLLVAVVLSAQATDVGVNKATKKLFATTDAPEKMLGLGEAGLKEHIKTIGLYNTKAKNILALSQKLITDFNGHVPKTLEQLESLPGVGRKTANVILNCLWGEHTIAVDTHVFRVSRRLGLSKGNTPEAVEKDLMKKIPDAFKQHAHHWLILHGRYTCKAQKPLCFKCPVAGLCPYQPKTPAP
jgi:endonuclease-3